MGRNLFRFLERDDREETVEELAYKMHLYPSSEVLRAGFVCEEYRPEEIAKLQRLLSFDRVKIELSAKALEEKPKGLEQEEEKKIKSEKKQEKENAKAKLKKESKHSKIPQPIPTHALETTTFFGTKFGRKLPTDDQRALWSQPISEESQRLFVLPPENIFIPTKFELVQEADIFSPQCAAESYQTLTDQCFCGSMPFLSTQPPVGRTSVGTVTNGGTPPVTGKKRVADDRGKTTRYSSKSKEEREGGKESTERVGKSNQSMPPFLCSRGQNSGVTSPFDSSVEPVLLKLDGPAGRNQDKQYHYPCTNLRAHHGGTKESEGSRCGDHLPFVWFSPLSSYRSPRIAARLLCQTGMTDRTPFHRACALLYVNLLTDWLEESTYDATYAELEHEIRYTRMGLGLCMFLCDVCACLCACYVELRVSFHSWPLPLTICSILIDVPFICG